MKPIFTLLLVLCFLFSYSQSPYHYRPAPKTGEWVALAGIAMVATASFINQYNDKSETGMVMNMVGYGTIMAGVSIDLYQKPGCKHHKKAYYKRLRVKVVRRR